MQHGIIYFYYPNNLIGTADSTQISALTLVSDIQHLQYLHQYRALLTQYSVIMPELLLSVAAICICVCVCVCVCVIVPQRTHTHTSWPLALHATASRPVYTC